MKRKIIPHAREFQVGERVRPRPGVEIDNVLNKRESQTGSNNLEPGAEPQALRPADTTEFTPTGFSVTEGTTKHLNSFDRKQ